MSDGDKFSALFAELSAGGGKKVSQYGQLCSTSSVSADQVAFNRFACKQFQQAPLQL